MRSVSALITTISSCFDEEPLYQHYHQAATIRAILEQNDNAIAGWLPFEFSSQLDVNLIA